jgi:hypothetical protein
VFSALSLQAQAGASPWLHGLPLLLLMVVLQPD